jgi:hypothetical protein
LGIGAAHRRHHRCHHDGAHIAGDRLHDHPL